MTKHILRTFFLFQRLLTLLIISLKLWKPSNHKYVEYLNIWERSHLKRTLKKFPSTYSLGTFSSRQTHPWTEIIVFFEVPFQTVQLFTWGLLQPSSAFLLDTFQNALKYAIHDLNIILKFFVWKQVTEQWLCLCWKETYACVFMCVCVCKKTEWNWKDTNIKSGYMKDIQNFVKSKLLS